ncbi:hypothetical protein CGLO_13140 [Colletotrichum gloeosporioides Cg-14]|uniref:Uncharacterized protein n=1 Tax=Colletotrichum gloeosporioides (strain Cg-14) TaxID=1237896 RepID=T0JX27_COLGC|nr:hypothetical protein CGLO_13140 [Colletotrichum gloeosporioides Cg-14]
MLDSPQTSDHFLLRDAE